MKNGHHVVPDYPEPPTFKESEAVISDYARGVVAGVAQREAMACEVMEWAAQVERKSLTTESENAMLRAQRGLLIFVLLLWTLALFAAL